MLALSFAGAVFLLFLALTLRSSFFLAFVPPGSTVTSSSSSTTEPRPLPPPLPMDPEICCICLYEPHPECGAFSNANECLSTQCKDGKDNDGDQKIDAADPECADENGVYFAADNSESLAHIQSKNCRWHGLPGEQESCKSEFEALCLNWLEYQKDQVQCGSPLLLPLTESLSDHQDFLDQCATTRLAVMGHANELDCPMFFDTCLRCKTPKCTKLLAQHIGCSVFQNWSDVWNQAQKFQALLLPEEEIVVTAPQTLSSAKCGARLRVEITSQKISLIPPKCEFGKRCLGSALGVACTENGARLQSCCKTANGKGYVWVQGDICP